MDTQSAKRGRGRPKKRDDQNDPYLFRDAALMSKYHEEREKGKSTREAERIAAKFARDQLNMKASPRELHRVLVKYKPLGISLKFSKEPAGNVPTIYKGIPELEEFFLKPRLRINLLGYWPNFAPKKKGRPIKFSKNR